MAETAPSRSPRMTVGAVSGRAFWVFVSTIGTLVIGYAASLITARVLGPDDRGLLAILQSDTVVATQVLAVGVQDSVLYYGSRRPRFRPGLLGHALIQTAILAVISVGAVLLVGEPLADAQGGSFDRDLWLLASTLVPLMFLEFTLLHLVQARLNFRLPNLMAIVARLAVFATTIVLVVHLDYGVKGAVWALIVFEVVQIVAYFPVAARDGLGFSRLLSAAALKYGVRVQFGTLFRLAAGRFDLMLLSFLAPRTTVAYYAIAQIVAELVLLTPKSMATVLQPVVSAGGETSDLSGASLRVNGTVSLVSVVGVAVFGPLLIILGYGEAFEPAIVPSLILLPGLWFQSAGNLSASVLSSLGKPGTGSAVAVFQGVLTVILDIILIPPFGAIGAAVASAIAYTAYGIAALAVLARNSRRPFTSLLLMDRNELGLAGKRMRSLLRR
jgi:O-antigen/teichoic acid export membrane protein